MWGSSEKALDDFKILPETFFAESDVFYAYSISGRFNS